VDDDDDAKNTFLIVISSQTAFGGYTATHMMFDES